jgi:hypothetical protein
MASTRLAMRKIALILENHLMGATCCGFVSHERSVAGTISATSIYPGYINSFVNAKEINEFLFF